jgi:hypothetical protein
MTDTSGPTSRTPSAYFDPDSCCWRTYAATFPWADPPSLQTLPAWGTTRGGELFELPTSVPATVASGSSSLPTPTARDHKGAIDPATRDRTSGSLDEAVEFLLPTPSAADGMGGHLTRGGDRSDEKLLPGIAVDLSSPPPAPPTARRADRDSATGAA